MLQISPNVLEAGAGRLEAGQTQPGLASGLQTGTAWAHDLASGRRRLGVEAEK